MERKDCMRKARIGTALSWGTPAPHGRSAREYRHEAEGSLERHSCDSSVLGPPSVIKPCVIKFFLKIQVIILHSLV